MIEMLIVAIAALSLIALSSRANTRFRREARLPMQWSFSGGVNWTAPRVLALSFTPALATCILTTAAAAMLVSEPRPGQEGLGPPVLMFMAFGFLAAHLLHLRMIEKALRGGSR